MRVFQLTVLLMTLLVGVASSEPGSHLKPGDYLPNIEEFDQTGQMRTLQELLGPKGTVFVVFRSADW